MARKIVPTDLELKSTGGEGHYIVIATILKADGSGIKGEIRFLFQGCPVDFPTDDRGVVEIPVDFVTRQEELRFLVLGTAIDKTLRLNGPKPKKPVCPNPKKRDLRSPLGAFLAGWQARKKA